MELATEFRQNASNIVFLDLELTALPSEFNSKILEVAILITTKDFVELGRKQWCIHTPKKELKLLSSWHQQHFKSVNEGGNGLFDAVSGCSEFSDLAYVTNQVLDMLSQHCPAKQCKLAGYSVHCDREVLSRQMPMVYNYMSHQILDISTILNAATIWAPSSELSDRPSYRGGVGHRAMRDVLHSLADLKFLKNQFFQRSPTVPAYSGSMNTLAGGAFAKPSGNIKLFLYYFDETIISTLHEKNFRLGNFN